MVRLPDGTERSTLVDRLAMIDSTKSGDILKALAAPAPAPPSRALDPKSKEHPKGVPAAPAQRAAPLDEARWPQITAAGRCCPLATASGPTAPVSQIASWVAAWRVLR